MAEQTLYEILGVTRSATSREIEEAYVRAKTTYDNESVAHYSLFSDDEKERQEMKLLQAYEILKDSSTRKKYDSTLAAHESGEPLKVLEFPSNISDMKKNGTGRTISFKKTPPVTDGRNPQIAEQYRILFTRIEHASVMKSLKSIAVTSAIKGEGKTSTSVNLAYMMAEGFRKKVLLVEGDLRNPSITSYFREDAIRGGLIDLIRGKMDIDDVIVQVEGSRLYILPSGGSARNSTELISSTRLSKIFTRLKEEFDYLIIDCPPVLSLADMNVISKIVDTMVLVVRAGSTPKDMVLKAVNALTGAEFIGAVLNGAVLPQDKYYYY